MFFISEEGPVTGGWDLKLGSKAMARRWARNLVRKFGGTVKETSTVVGANDGIEVTRLTLSYRKPAYGNWRRCKVQKTPLGRGQLAKGWPNSKENGEIREIGGLMERYGRLCGHLS